MAVPRSRSRCREETSPGSDLRIERGGTRSGGALAFAPLDHLWATPDSYFAVVVPEAVIAILKQGLGELRPTADRLRSRPGDLTAPGVVRGIIES